MLNNFQTTFNRTDFVEKLALEMLYESVAPHIEVSVQALDKPKTVNSVGQLGQYIVMRVSVTISYGNIHYRNNLLIGINNLNQQNHPNSHYQTRTAKHIET